MAQRRKAPPAAPSKGAAGGPAEDTKAQETPAPTRGAVWMVPDGDGGWVPEGEHLQRQRKKKK